jgi:hypothetical protein
LETIWVAYLCQFGTRIFLLGSVVVTNWIEYMGPFGFVFTIICIAYLDQYGNRI